jgi:predicted nucleic acid-binding protein
VAIYLDTSVLLHAILGTDATAYRWFADVCEQERLVSSRLLRLEIERVMHREALDANKVAEPFLQRIALISIDDAILAAAGTIPEHIKTLDSIHLATLLRSDPEMKLATHDRNMIRVAASLGIKVIDPLEAVGDTQ